MIHFIKKNIYLCFFILLAIIVFAHNHSINLWDQDEAAYAGFAKNMVESGDYLIPDFMWSDIHRKPPLHFWNIAGSSFLFGINEFSVRFPSALLLLLTYLCIYFWGTKLFDKKTAFISAVVLSTTLFVPSLAKISVTDATLLFFSTLCAFSVLQVLKQPNVTAIVIFWVSFSLALLTKGPQIVIFCGVLATLFFIFHENRKNLFKFHPWFFLPIAAAPLFIWGYMTTMRDDGEFINWMIDWYIIKRIGGSVLGQTGPPGMHIALIIGFFSPYIMFFPKAFWKGVRGVVKDKDDNLLLGAWFIAGWLLYEFSPSKLPAYAIVAHVPLAILIGKVMIGHMESKTRPGNLLVILHFVISIAIISALPIASFILEFSSIIKLTFIIFSTLMLIGIIIAIRSIKTKHFIIAILGINLFFQFAVWVIILPQIDGYKNSPKQIGKYIFETAVPESTVVLGNDRGHPPSLPFYISLNFDVIEDEQDYGVLISKYKSEDPCVLVLNLDQKDHFESVFPKLKYAEFNSFLVDRKGKANYFVVMNETSYK